MSAAARAGGPQVTRADISQQVIQLEDRLAVAYADRVPEPLVRQAVRTAYADVANARVLQFVPVLVEHSARDAIRGLAR